VQAALDAQPAVAADSLDAVLAADAAARNFAGSWVQSQC
jgi:hypothetical protein